MAIAVDAGPTLRDVMRPPAVAEPPPPFVVPRPSEVAPRVEIFSRDEVQNTFNSTFTRWRDKVYGEVQYFPEKNFADMVKAGRIPAERMDEYGKYFMLQDAVLALSGDSEEVFDRPLGTQVKDTLTTHFLHPSGQEFNREEGIGVEDLQDFIENEINSGKLTFEEVVQRRHELEVLEASSKPYSGLHPDALSDANSEEHARIEEEARRMYENPAFKKGTSEEDWLAAKARLARREELIIPKSETAPIMPVSVPLPTREKHGSYARWITLVPFITGVGLGVSNQDTMPPPPPPIVEVGTMPSQEGIVTEQQNTPQTPEAEKKFMTVTINKDGDGITQAALEQIYGGEIPQAWMINGKPDADCIMQDVYGALQSEENINTLSQYEDKKLIDLIKEKMKLRYLIGDENTFNAWRNEINDYNQRNRPDKDPDFLHVKKGQTFTMEDHRASPSQQSSSGHLYY